MLKLTKDQYLKALISNERMENFITLELTEDDQICIHYKNTMAKKRRSLIRSSVKHGKWEARLHLLPDDVIAIVRDRHSSVPRYDFYSYNGMFLTACSPDIVVSKGLKLGATYCPTQYTAATWLYMGISRRLFGDVIHHTGIMLETAHIPSISFTTVNDEVPGNVEFRPMRNRATAQKYSSLEYWVYDLGGKLKIVPATSDKIPSDCLGSVFIGYKYSKISFVAKDEVSKLYMRDILVKKILEEREHYIASISDNGLSLRVFNTPNEQEQIELTD